MESICVKVGEKKQDPILVSIVLGIAGPQCVFLGERTSQQKRRLDIFDVSLI